MTPAFVVITGLAWAALAADRPQIRIDAVNDTNIQAVADGPRPWIGVQIQNVGKHYAEERGLPETTGALVVGVAKSGPASSAGLKVGDVVLMVDEEPVEDARAFAGMIKKYAPGDAAKLTIDRDGQSMPVTVTIKSRP